MWLCDGCYERFAEHELEPEELLALARRAAARVGKCDSCTAVPPAAQVRVPGGDGYDLTLHLCASCAREASRTSAGRILHAQAALEGDVTIDPRYEKALEVARRRASIRRVK